LHFIGGLGGTGKSALFRKLHTACCSKGLLIAICAATSLAALLFEGDVTAHSLFGYPVEDKKMLIISTQQDVKLRRSEQIFSMKCL
jgi:hypothetical protein